MQGKTNKKLRFLRASGPLTAVVLGTLFVKIFRPTAISVVSKLLLLCCPELYDVMQYSKIAVKPVPWFAFFFHLTFVLMTHMCSLRFWRAFVCMCVSLNVMIIDDSSNIFVIRFSVKIHENTISVVIFYGYLFFIL